MDLVHPFLDPSELLVRAPHPLRLPTERPVQGRVDIGVYVRRSAVFANVILKLAHRDMGILKLAPHACGEVLLRGADRVVGLRLSFLAEPGFVGFVGEAVEVLHDRFRLVFCCFLLVGQRFGLQNRNQSLIFDRREQGRLFVGTLTS